MKKSGMALCMLAVTVLSAVIPFSLLQVREKSILGKITTDDTAYYGTDMEFIEGEFDFHKQLMMICGIWENTKTVQKIGGAEYTDGVQSIDRSESFDGLYQFLYWCQIYLPFFYEEDITDITQIKYEDAVFQKYSVEVLRTECGREDQPDDILLCEKNTGRLIGVSFSFSEEEREKYGFYETDLSPSFPDAGLKEMNISLQRTLSGDEISFISLISPPDLPVHNTGSKSVYLVQDTETKAEFYLVVASSDTFIDIYFSPSI